MNRIKPIDGLRTIAVLGVIWIHIWTFFGNLNLHLGPVNVYRLIAIVGNGVDLFFVISGFCMYLMYTKKYPGFSFTGYGNFVWGRWKRIAPAFYAAVIIYFLLRYNELAPDAISILAAHFLFVHTVWNVTELAAPFWSLATEWHFYMVLPFLLLIGRTEKRFQWAFWFLMIACLGFRFWLFGVHQQGINDLSLTDRIYVRFVEFGWGILACKFYLSGKEIPKSLQGFLGFMLALGIAYAGRIMMTTELVNRAGSAGFVFKALSEPLMTFGFALMILNVIRSESVFVKILNSLPFQFIGKVSYSMYLWHWLIAYTISAYMMEHYGVNQGSLLLSFVISVVLLIPISWLSYFLFEQFYFKGSRSISSKTQAVSKS